MRQYEIVLEREKGLEPSTGALGRHYSTTELLPQGAKRSRSALLPVYTQPGLLGKMGKKHEKIAIQSFLTLRYSMRVAEDRDRAAYPHLLGV